MYVKPPPWPLGSFIPSQLCWILTCSYLGGLLSPHLSTIPCGNPLCSPFILNFPLTLTQTCWHWSPSCHSLPCLLPGPQDKRGRKSKSNLAEWSQSLGLYHLVTPPSPGPRHFLVYIFPLSILSDLNLQVSDLFSTLTALFCALLHPGDLVPRDGGHSRTMFHSLPPLKTWKMVLSFQLQPPHLLTIPTASPLLDQVLSSLGPLIPWPFITHSLTSLSCLHLSTHTCLHTPLWALPRLLS